MSCPRTVNFGPLRVLLLVSGGLWAGCDADPARTDDVNVPVVNWPGMEPHVAQLFECGRARWLPVGTKGRRMT